MTLQKLERAPLLHQSVQEALKAYVMDNELRPGDPLPAESELARQLGVSRSSVREAVKALETLGMFESRRGSGLYVGSFSFDPLVESLPYGLMIDSQDIAELLDVRCTLELALVERFIERKSPAQVAALEIVLKSFEAVARAKEPIDGPDQAFHQHLAENLGNRVLMRLIDVFWRSYNRASQQIDLVNLDPVSTYADHVAIFEAFVAGDVSATKATIDRHYDGIRTLLMERGRGRIDLI